MDLNSFPELTPQILQDDYYSFDTLYTKGDDVQKLSVIQSLPQLLDCDANATLTRILPKIQQELPKSSCEFHIATSKIFRILIEKQIPLDLTGAVLQGCESKDPVVSNAWIETLLAAIPFISLEQVKSDVMNLAVSKSQMNKPAYARISSCRILGKVAVHPKISAIDVKANILPLVQSLCQDCFQDVRAAMCSQLHFIAQGLGDNLGKSSLLPSLVELSSDDNMNVRSSAMSAVVLIIPYLPRQTKIETIVPLIKQMCQKSVKDSDTTFPTIAREFGRLIDGLQSDLDNNDSIWFLEFFKTLSRKGRTAPNVKDSSDATQSVVCRQQCAYNLPAVTFFTVTQISGHIEVWRSVFSDLANDSCYLVRKTIAGCLHEILRILGPHCRIVKQDVVRLLRDDSEEVLELLVPNLGTSLDLLGQHGVLIREGTSQSTLEIARGLLKCHSVLCKGHNWRVKTEFFKELERLPNCMPSEFIHQHFTPVILTSIIESKPKPVKSQASRTVLVFLRNNLKEVQRKWIRDHLVNSLCYSKSCYVRHIYIKMCVHAFEIFSFGYIKAYFYQPLLTLFQDPVSNIRLCVVALLPILQRMLISSEDKSLQKLLEATCAKMDVTEKNRDVKQLFKLKTKELRAVMNTPNHEVLMEEKRRQEEENKIAQGKLINQNHRSSISRSASVAPSIRSSQQSAASRTSATTPRSEMSFLDQHFYIDAGVSFPLERVKSVDFASLELLKKLSLKPLDRNENEMIPTVSLETINVASMSVSELTRLGTTTTNITDDVKVNLRMIQNGNNNQKRGKIIPPKILTTKEKRFSSVFSNSCLEKSNSKVMNRRSLNITSGDLSRIPVCLKKSKSNADVDKDESKSTLSATVSLKDIGIDRKSDTKNKVTVSNNRLTIVNEISSSSTNNTYSIQSNNVPIKNSIKDNKDASSKVSSSLPVLKRRSLSEVRK